MPNFAEVKKYPVHYSLYTHTLHCSLARTHPFPGGGSNHPTGAMSHFVAATAIPFIQPFQDDVEEDSGVSTEGGREEEREGGEEREREWWGGGEGWDTNSRLH